MNRDPAPAQRPRVVRFFVSSTFRDMRGERDELVKQVFPQLRKLCESRDVTWGEVDLRWGIPDEQQAEASVLRTCLAEIDSCRPFFIGILGERYGWVPEAIDVSLLDERPWLAEEPGRSITELEIASAVLNHPGRDSHAFFYLRDPSYSVGDPELRESPTDVELLRYGTREAERRAEARRQQLARLKERIRCCGAGVRENYRDPAELAALVLSDLTTLIDRLFPEAAEPTPLEREAALHEAFARSRARVYIGRPEHFARLDAHADGDGPPVVVLGAAGSGKSALLSNWALRRRAHAREELVLFHSVGASASSVEVSSMLARVIGELNDHFGLGLEIPNDPHGLRSAFADALQGAAARDRLVLVIDALNQLEDRDGAHELAWLPSALPPGVRLVVASLPGRALEQLTRRGWPTLIVEPLEPEERERLIVAYLAEHKKALAAAQVERVAAQSQCASPLFLRMLLEELRLYGDHETLEKRIDHHLSAPDVDRLYDQILARYELDYERARPGLVGDVMTLLWAARRGLSESELLDLLGEPGQPLPSAHWAPLHLAAEQALIDRAGLLGFAHEQLRHAVAARYLPDDYASRAAHARLSDYFAGRDPGTRQVDELPWQLMQAGAWTRLFYLLGDGEFLDSTEQSMSMAVLFDLRRYWAQLETASSLRMLDAYEHYRNALGAGMHIAAQLMEDTYPAEALEMWTALIERGRGRIDGAILQRWLGQQATLLDRQGDLDGALGALEEKARICRELGHQDGLANALGKQALVLRARGDNDAALALMHEQEEISRRTGNLPELAASLGNQGRVLKDRGELDGALALLKEEERLCREAGRLDSLAASLFSQALVLKARGHLDAALARLREQEQICRDTGNLSKLHFSLGQQAVIARRRGGLDAALTLAEEQERLCRQLRSPRDLAVALGVKSLILADLGDLEGSLALCVEEERILRELGLRAELWRPLGGQAAIARRRGDINRALELLREQERICRELRDPQGLAKSLGNQAQLAMQRGDLRYGLALLTEEARLVRALGDPNALQVSLGDQSETHRRLGDLERAIALAEERLQVCRKLGEPGPLAQAMAKWARVVTEADRPDEAVPVAQEAYSLARRHGLSGAADEAGRAAAYVLGSYGHVLLYERHQHDAALSVLDEAERICREVDVPRVLTRTLIHKAYLFSITGREQQAVTLAEEALALARRHEMPNETRWVESFVRARTHR